MITNLEEVQKFIRDFADITSQSVPFPLGQHGCRRLGAVFSASVIINGKESHKALPKAG